MATAEATKKEQVETPKLFDTPASNTGVFVSGGASAPTTFLIHTLNGVRMKVQKMEDGQAVLCVKVGTYAAILNRKQVLDLQQALTTLSMD